MSFLLPCPNCGERSVYEFRFGGEIKERPSPDAPDDAWQRYSYANANVAGAQQEWWYHTMGCRQWFVAQRNTLSNEVLETALPGAAPGTPAQGDERGE